MKKHVTLLLLTSLLLGAMWGAHLEGVYFLIATVGLFALLAGKVAGTSVGRSAFVGLAIAVSATASATDYCDTTRNSATPNNSYTLNYTCKHVSGTTYQMVLDFADAVTGINNANIGANPGPVNVAATPVWTNSNHTLTYTFTASATPSLYVAIIFVNIGGVEVRWDLPTDANFNALCSTGTPPTITFADINKTQGDPDFTVMASSDSPGAITYTSGNTAVATITGNTVHIVGAGTSVITANQAASGSFSAGSQTATLTVALLNPEPTAGPATPPARNPWDVLSQYGAAYTNQSGVTFYDFGGSVIVGDVTLGDGSVVKKYTNHSFSGISTNGAGSLNVSAMTTLHMDVWSPNFTSFRVKLEAANGSNVELNAPGGAGQGTWNSYDIPLSNYAAVDLANLRYIVPVTFGQNATLFITNVYFYRPATTQPPTLGTFTVPAANVGDPDFAITPPTSNSAGAWSYTSSNTAVATIVGGNMIHIAGGGTSTITATQAADGAYGSGTATATLTVTYPDPGASPAQPPRDPGDVISIFADPYYTNISGTDFNPDWGQSANYPANLTTPAYGGNVVKQYQNTAAYQGTNLPSDTDVTAINKFHIDIYSPTLTSVRVSLISTTGGTHEFPYLINLTPGTWTSADIDANATNFPGVDLTKVSQIKYDEPRVNGVVSAGQVLAVDNLYFYREVGVAPTLGAFTVPDKVLGDPDFALTPPTSDSAGTWSYTSSNTAVATISGGNIHIVGAGTSTITATQAANAGFTSASTTALFSVAVPPLTTPAPTPPARNPWDVVSVYSNAYTNTPTAAWSADAVVEDVQLSGNDTKKISNFLIETVEFGAQDLTAMTMMHVDVYSDDCTGLNLWLLNNGDRVAQRTVALNQWNSFDIPLSTYTGLGLNLNGVHLLKFESLNGPGKTIYVDNVYFYRPATSLPPTLSNFTIPTQAYNSPDFLITPPTSNSAGAFSYTSSNTAVATIVGGNTIHIVGPGTSTITATQAADGGFGSGSITALLTVTYPAPGPSPVPPARTPDRVISMFTGNPPVYANAITAVASNWTTGTVMSEIPNGTNTALKLDNFGFLGLVDQAETHFGVVGMTNLHVDVYVNTPLSSLAIYLLANGDYLYTANGLAAGWNSLSIPLTNYGAADLSQVWGLKFEQYTGSPIQMYLDNVYFSNECYTYYADADNDGYGNPAVSQQFCGDGVDTTGYSLDNTDCNDADNTVHQTFDFYADNDNDGYGAGISVAVCAASSTSAPAGYSVFGTDCDDTKASVHPGATEIGYNLTDDDCDGLIDEGFPPKQTTIGSAQCNTTLASIDSQLVAGLVAGAQGYRWRITTMSGPSAGEVQEIDTPLRALRLTQLAHYAFGTTYQVEVAVYYAGFLQPYLASTCTVSTPSATTQLSNCNQQMTNMSDAIYANIVAYATGYKFRITDPLTPANTQEIERPVRDVRMTMVNAFVVQYGKSYNVEVAVKNTDGTYLPYGPVCTVNTPTFPTTSLQDSQCDGYAVPSANTQIYAGSYPGAIKYVFRMSGPGITGYQEVTRNTRSFTLSMFTGWIATNTYDVSVRLIFNDADPMGPYGKVCSIVAPGLARVAKDKTLAFDAVAYPNPSTERFNIHVTTAATTAVSVNVYDMTGRLIGTQKAEAGSDIQLGENYPSGVYNVVVSQGDEVKTLRVIKR